MISRNQTKRQGIRNNTENKAMSRPKFTVYVFLKFCHSSLSMQKQHSSNRKGVKKINVGS